MGALVSDPERGKLRGYLKLLQRHRGEAGGSYDEVASVYDDFASVWDRKIAAPALEHYDRIIEQRVRPGAYVLDAGAGTGERTLAILRHSRPGAVVALDASAGMLEVARAKIRDPRVDFMVGDLNSLPFEDDTFDVVSCSWAVEIMADPRAAVQELIRVLKPGGVVIYAFCSLPEGPLGRVLKQVIARVASKERALSHLLAEDERPFHRCAYSSLKQFAGGLTTVATVGKCCDVSDELLPCPAGAVATARMLMPEHVPGIRL